MNYTQEIAVRVIDRLATDYTSANFQKIAEFLDNPDPVIAGRAAWRVAPFYTIRGFSRSNVDGVLPPRKGPADWAWEPFTVPEIARMMVSDLLGFLAKSPDESVPDPLPILPPEVALPMLVLVALEIRQMPFERVWEATLTSEQISQMEDLVASGKLHTQDADKGYRGLVNFVLNKANAPRRIRALLNSLPGQAQLALTQNIKFDRLPTPEDWLALFRPNATQPQTSSAPNLPPASNHGWTIGLSSLGLSVVVYLVTERLVLAIVIAVIGQVLASLLSPVRDSKSKSDENPLAGAHRLIQPTR